jgi:glycogen phosphorylase
VLGIGGVRALRALGIEPQVFHSNEGHAGFASLERIRELVAEGLTFPEALEAVRTGGVFTTHTPVPAGIDRFPVEMMWRYFGPFAQACGIDIDELLELGRRADEPEDLRFNMAVMGMRLNDRSNGVARLHGEVSRAMFQGLWPEVPLDEVPIGHITNGVHAHTWVSADVDRLLSTHVHGSGTAPTRQTWAGVHDIDDDDLTHARNQGRAELVSSCAQHMGEGVLDPDVLTIGFARRFATYKRATLLLHHPERLRAMLLDPDRPVQFVFAGKAHPADQPGKEMIRGIERVRPPARRPPSVRVPARLRHAGGAGHVPRLRRVVEQPAPTHGGLRHQRHEGGAERGAQPVHPRRLVGRVLRRRERMGHPLRRRRPRHRPPGRA